MNVVPDTRSIRRTVIISINSNLIAVERRRNDQRDQVRFRIVPLPDFAIGIGSGRVEVPKRIPRKSVRNARVNQSIFDKYLGLPLPQFYSNRGFVYESQGRTRDAIDDFKHALLGDPSIVDARAALKRLGALDATVETDRRVREGEALAEKNCSRCHAVGAKGVSPNKDAPEFRNVYRRHQLYALRASNTRALAAVHDQMPQFNSSFEEIDTIVAYINSLSTGR